MRYSQLFPKTRKDAPKEAVAVNHKLLVRAGFIDQLMAGSWTLLPLGWRVITKINNIIREEMDAIGGQEMLMPLLHPKEIWNETGRWDEAKEIMYTLKDTRKREFALSFTHEEIVMDLIRKHASSYHDLPIKVYHFSTKFRNEPRATAGILRGREFFMKDLYSAHATEEDLMKYYWEVKDAYLRIFTCLGLQIRITEASGGVFTENHTHEFQVVCATGEDTIYICDHCDWGYNKEIFIGRVGDSCPRCHQGKIIEKRSIETGNIFPLGTKYAEKMNAYYVAKDGSKKPYWFGSYGIGPSRVLGTIVEVSHDDRGIIWPEAVAPYHYHLIGIKDQRSKIKDQTEEIYNKLISAGKEVLYDDRDEVSAGEKFADCDLIGCPYRLVVSEKTLRQGSGQAGEKVEIKNRREAKTDLLTVEQIINWSQNQFI